jgi:hypothetical protein
VDVPAAALRAALAQDGITADEIATAGRGKTDLAVPTPDGRQGTSQPPRLVPGRLARSLAYACLRRLSSAVRISVLPSDA